VALLLATFGMREAQAHARLLRASPPQRTELTKSPPQIDLWFNELLDDGFNSIIVKSAQKPAAETQNLAKEKPRLDPKDKTHLITPLDPLPPGEYVAEWRVLSRDGHAAPGKFNFRVLAPR